MDPSQLKPYISKEKIDEKIKEISGQITHEYKHKDLVIIMVLKGALCLVADLIREIDLPLDLETVQCSSYGQHGTQRGELAVIGLEKLKIHNRDVLIIDDIFDSGHTMIALVEKINALKPRSIKTCVLLNKLNVPKVSDYRPDYVLFDIEDAFVVGYGLDYKERYRNLPGVFIFEER